MAANDSLHVKYRPATFEEVVGHKAVVKSVQKTIEDGRAHVFLFTGPAGLGKTSFARIIANAVCGGKATAANIVEVQAANYTGVDAMRSILDKAVTKAIGESPCKVIILDEAHRLTGNAWDALLKATEEPPRHVYYVFCTTVAGKIPKTILTRCQQFELSPLSEEEITKILKRVIKKEKLDVLDEVVEAISESSGGSARQALTYLESCLYCESANEARKIMKQAGQTKEVIDLCRFLIGRQGRDWKTALTILNAIKDQEAESIRIVICNYFATAILGSKSEKDAARLMSILDYFSTPYYPAEKFAPLLLSVGAALELNT